MDRGIKTQIDEAVEKLRKELTEKLVKNEIDFSILNKTDVFYVETEDNEYLFKKKENGYIKAYDLKTDRAIEETYLNGSNIVELTIASPQLKVLFLSHFPEKTKVWIEVYKTSGGKIQTCTHYSQKEAEFYNTKSTLEIIEKEY